MGQHKTLKRKQLESVDLIEELLKYKQSYLIDKYGVTKSLFQVVLTEQYKVKRIDQELKSEKIHYLDYESNLLSSESSGAWMKSKERQFLINKRNTIWK